MEEVGKCPFCGEIMEKGFLISGRNIDWWPNKPLPSYCEGEEIARSARPWQWKCPHLPAYRCKKCSTIVIRYSEEK